MRKSWLFLFSATIFVFIQFNSQAQTKEKVWNRNKANNPHSKFSGAKKEAYADELYRKESYFEAIDYYQQLKKDDERNVYYTYQLAECYRFTRDYVPASHYYAEAYEYSRKVYPMSSYYAGLMFKQQGEYQTAMKWFTTYVVDNKKISKPGNYDPRATKQQTAKDIKILKKQVKIELEGCTMAMASMKDPGPFNVTNCGPNINTFLTELSPYPLGDSALLFSTTGREAVFEDNGRQKIALHEHFLYSHKQPGYVDSFQWPLPFYDGNFNDKNFHTGNGCMSPGGDRFYFSQCGEEIILDTPKIICKIRVASWQKNHWVLNNPNPAANDPLGFEQINLAGSSNTMPFVAKVGKKEVLFFVSDRKLQSRGGFDIWYSVIDPRNGSFKRPQNCGKKINTPFDEVTPYYDSRIQKLFFATTGLRSMGGSDIYSADGGPSRYSNIHNMGYPINTCADELYYINDPVGKPDAYVVSNRIGSFALKNPTCCNDIWRIQVEPRLVVIGKVLDRKNQQLVSSVVVKMVDQRGELNTYNSEDGNFLFNLQRGHSYVITGDKIGYTTNHNPISTMDIKRSDPDDTVQVTVFLDTIKNDFKVNNVFYDYGEATLRPESMQALDSLVSFMKDNPSITIEIYSFTDGIGKQEQNLALSQRRAQSVVDYLEKNTIDRGRMKAVGLGTSNIVAPEKDENGKDIPENRQKNRRTEFRIVSDLPTKRVLFNSAKKGTMNQQMENLKVPDYPDEEGAGDKQLPNDDDK